MVTILLVFVVAIDLIMLGIIYFGSKQRQNPIELLKEIAQEKRALKELQTIIQDDLKQKKQGFEDLYRKINGIAAEAEIEARSYSGTMGTEMAKVLDEFSQKLQITGSEIAEQKSSLSALLKKCEKERVLLKKSTIKAEKLSKFFSRKIPYEELLEEIEDKKYVDARQLLSQGLSSHEVSQEVGLPESEVALIAAIG